jgi:hypothetical protein
VVTDQLPPQLDVLFPRARPEERVRINRLDDWSKKPVIHGYLAAAEATEQFIAERWGGGKYICIHLRRNERGQDVYNEQRQVDVPGPYKPPTEVYGLPKAESPNPAIAPEVGTLNGRIPPGMTAREALDNALLSRVFDLLDRKPAPETKPVDWPAMLTAGAGIITALGAMMTRKGPDPELVKMIEKLEVALKATPGPAQSSISDITKAIRELLGVREMLTPENGTQRGESGMLETILSKLLELISSRVQGGAGVVPGQPSFPRPDAPAPVSSPRNESPVVNPLPMWQQLLLAYREQIMMFARRGMDPDLAGPLALQFIPQDMMGVLVEFVRRDDAALLVRQTIPEMAEFDKWTQDFVHSIRAELLEDEEEEPAEEPE